MEIIAFIEGPLWTAALVIFLAGAAWRIIGIIRLPGTRELSVPRASAVLGAVRGILLHSLPHGGFFSRTAYHVFAGYLFHIGLFAVVLFAAPHITFIKEQMLGVGWPALPRWGFIIAGQAALAGLLMLWIRRMTDPVMRQISDAGDHIGSGLTFLALLTGCLALGESHASLRAIHMLSVEAFLIYFPFSRLMHAVTFIFSRAYTGITYGRRGYVP